MSSDKSIDKMTLFRHRVFAIVAVVAITAWAIVGVFDRSGWGRYDPLFQPDYTILHAPEGRTLESAGFQQGDSVISVEGIPVEELGMYSRWPRSLRRKPGESLTLVVDREGQTLSADIVLRDPRAGNNNLLLGGSVILLAFVGAGLWALFSTGSIHGVRLAYIGLTPAAAIPGPYLGGWDGVAMHFQVAMFVLWTLLLLRFFLLFPQTKRIGQNRVATALIFGGWLVLIVTLILELIFHPRFYHTFGPLYGLLMFVYSVFAVAALIHTLIKTPKGQQRESGMRIILTGAMAGLIPTIVAEVDRMFLWNIDIPGSSWFPLALGAIPISMAIAVRRQAGGLQTAL